MTSVGEKKNEDFKRPFGLKFYLNLPSYFFFFCHLKTLDNSSDDVTRLPLNILLAAVVVVVVWWWGGDQLSCAGVHAGESLQKAEAGRGGGGEVGMRARGESART